MRRKMKVLVSGGLSLALVLSSVTLPDGGDRAKAEEMNLITNGDFETGVVTPWTVTSGKETVTAEVADWAKQNGSYGLALKDSAEWKDGVENATFDLTQKIAKLSKGKYTLTVHAMGKGGEGLKLVAGGEKTGEQVKNTSSTWGTWDTYTFNLELSEDTTDYEVGVEGALWAGGESYCFDDITLAASDDGSTTDDSSKTEDSSKTDDDSKTDGSSDEAEEPFLDVYAEDYSSTTENSLWTSSWENKDTEITDEIGESQWKTWTKTAQKAEFTAKFDGLEAGEYRFSMTAVGGDMDASTVTLGTVSKEILVNPWGESSPTVTDTVTIEEKGSLSVTLNVSYKDGGWVNFDDIKLQKKVDLEDLIKVYKDEISTLLKDFGELKESWYAEKAWAKLQTAIDAAKAIIEKENVTAKELIAAYKSLKSVRNNLREKSVYVNKVENLSKDFMRGADISSYISIIESGATFKDAEGNVLDDQGFFDLLKDSGINWVRIRVWNDPYDKDKNGYGAGNNDLEKAVKMGQWATKAGIRVLIDFHYSDFWADPGRQLEPKAWKDFTVEQKETALYQYTKESLEKLLEEGVDVGMVQVGNETNNGIAGVSEWADKCKLFSAGSKAIREVSSEKEKEIKAAVHFTDPQTPDNLTNIAAQLKTYDVDYDVFASSYYPATHGTMENITKVLNDVATEYGKEVMVAETSWAWTTDDGDGHGQSFDPGTYTDYALDIQGQATEIRDVVDAVNKVDNNKGIGVFYWEPAWIPVEYAYDEDGNLIDSIYQSNKAKWEKYGSGVAASYAGEYAEDVKTWYGGSVKDNESFFDFEGNPLATLTIFKDIYTGTEAPVKRLEVVKNTSVEVLLESSDVAAEISKVKAELPKTVTAVYNDSSREEFLAQWNADELNEVTDFGTYTVSGKVDYQDEYGTDTERAVSCSVTILPASILKNGDFESLDDGSWVVDGADGVELKWNDTPLRGDGALHFYSPKEFNFTIKQNVSASKAAMYCASFQLQGGSDGEAITAVIGVMNPKTHEVVVSSIESAGWADWKKAQTDSVYAAKDDELEVTITISGGDGAWGSIDEVFLYNSGKAVVAPSPAAPAGSEAPIESAVPSIVPAVSAVPSIVPAASAVPSAVPGVDTSAAPTALATAAPTETAAATAKASASSANKCTKLKAAKKTYTIKKKGKTVKAVFNITAKNSKKKTTDKIKKVTVGNKKVIKVTKKALTNTKSTKKVTVTVKGLKKGKSKLTVQVGAQKASTVIKVKK